MHIKYHLPYFLHPFNYSPRDLLSIETENLFAAKQYVTNCIKQMIAKSLFYQMRNHKCIS